MQHGVVPGVGRTHHSLCITPPVNAWHFPEPTIGEDIAESVNFGSRGVACGGHKSRKLGYRQLALGQLVVADSYVACRLFFFVAFIKNIAHHKSTSLDA